MTGLVLLNKPQGFTSFDAVARLRRLLGERKIGHTGTLDPMATGVLPLLVGNATPLCELLPNTSKAYRATLRFGLTTDTLDITGTVLTRCHSAVTAGQVEALLPRFTGDLQQLPPMYSAVSVNGVRLYRLARQGKTVARTPRPVTVYELALCEADEAAQRFTLFVRCSKGTYVRSLVSDMGEALGCGAVLTDLCRTEACGFSIAECRTLEQLEACPPAERLLPVERAVAAYPAVRVTDPQARRFLNGGALELRRLPLTNSAAGLWRVYAPNGLLLGLGEATPGQSLAVRCLLARPESQD